jgi:hypothetical protein
MIATVDQAEIERIQDENLRLRTALEQALLYVEEFRREGIESQALIAAINEALEPSTADG